MCSFVVAEVVSCKSVLPAELALKTCACLIWEEMADVEPDPLSGTCAVISEFRRRLWVPDYLLLILQPSTVGVLNFCKN
jgi:hypothetical protein